MLFSPTVSHYRREHAPNRLYLSSELTITDMHNDFLKKNPNMKMSYDSYRQVVSKGLILSLGRKSWTQRNFAPLICALVAPRVASVFKVQKLHPRKVGATVER